MQRDSFVLRLISEFFATYSAKISSFHGGNPAVLQNLKNLTRPVAFRTRLATGVAFPLAIDPQLTTLISREKPINKSVSIDKLFNKRNSLDNVYAMNNCLNLLYSLRRRFVLHCRATQRDCQRHSLHPYYFWRIRNVIRTHR